MCGLTMLGHILSHYHAWSYSPTTIMLGHILPHQTHATMAPLSIHSESLHNIIIFHASHYCILLSVALVYHIQIKLKQLLLPHHYIV